MTRLNWLFTLSSINILLVIAERFSFTTTVLLPPHDFLRLHELVQMTILILINVVIAFFILREVTNNFSLVKRRGILILMVCFFIGLYLYASGNAFHELASFLYHTYCLSTDMSQFCQGLYFNDYYIGNGIFYAGAILLNGSLIAIEFLRPRVTYTKKDMVITLINAVLYAFVLWSVVVVNSRIGVNLDFYYVLLMAALACLFFIKIRKNIPTYPVITYTTFAYVVGALASIPFLL